MTATSAIQRAFSPLQWAIVVLAIFGLAFRSFIWASWLPYPDEPYGVSDVVEGIIAVALFFFCAVAAVLAIVTIAIQRHASFKSGVKLLLVAVLVAAFYLRAHALVPTLRLW